MTTALLVDDEANLLDYLARKLKEIWPELEILATAQNGWEALSLVHELHPEVIFLDIHMPGMSGLKVAEQLPGDIAIVFITAYDEHAVEAFDRAAIDYVLKPVSDERLKRAVARLKNKETNADRIRLANLIRELSDGTGATYLQWLRAGREDTTRLVAVGDVVYFQADQKYTSVITADSELLIRTSIKELESQLDPNRFWRVHRGIIVNVQEIEEAKRDLRGRYTLKLKGRTETLRTSQSYRHLFRQM